MLRENTKEKLFDDDMNFKTLTVEKNIRQTLNVEFIDADLEI